MRQREDRELQRIISLLCSTYEIYAEILRRRLKEELETKEMIPESQTGFKKRRSTINNIFILNYIIQKETKRTTG